MPERIGLIAGNGTFPILVLDAARAQGFDVIVAAIKEEAFPEIEQHGAAAVHWLSLGELSKLIETFQREGVSRTDAEHTVLLGDPPLPPGVSSSRVTVGGVSTRVQQSGPAWSQDAVTMNSYSAVSGSVMVVSKRQGRWKMILSGATLL